MAKFAAYPISSLSGNVGRRVSQQTSAEIDCNIVMCRRTEPTANRLPPRMNRAMIFMSARFLRPSQVYKNVQDPFGTYSSVQLSQMRGCICLLRGQPTSRKQAVRAGLEPATLWLWPSELTDSPQRVSLRCSINNQPIIYGTTNVVHVFQSSKLSIGKMTTSIKILAYQY